MTHTTSRALSERQRLSSSHDTDSILFCLYRYAVLFWHNAPHTNGLNEIRSTDTDSRVHLCRTIHWCASNTTSHRLHYIGQVFLIPHIWDKQWWIRPNGYDVNNFPHKMHTNTRTGATFTQNLQILNCPVKTVFESSFNKRSFHLLQQTNSQRGFSQ